MKGEMSAIRLDLDDIRDFEASIRKEWIITNGLGGYASSTVLGINTRKHHGLLVSAFNPPTGRHVLLEKLDEEIVFEDRILPIYSNEFQHGIFPNGIDFLQEFRLDPLPYFRYNVEGIEIRKNLFMVYGKNALVTIYEVYNPHLKPIKFNVFPRLNLRHFHDITRREKLSWSYVQTPFSNGTFLRNEQPRIFLALGTDEGEYLAGEKWIDEIFYRVDASRKENAIDDYYQPGKFHFEVAANTRKKLSLVIVGSSDEDEVKNCFTELNRGVENAQKLLEQEINRRKQLLRSFYSRYEGLNVEGWLDWLVLAADSFIVYRRSCDSSSVIAGYHWFEDWGRDSLISLPGLTLVTGRFDKAREILLTFTHYCRKGMVPNRFPDKDGENPVYNTVDATLWYFNAVLQFLKYTGDFEFVKGNLWSRMKEIIEWHVKGTEYGIALDKDGLLAHGPQLTWMDAVVGKKAVTPRCGKAVEIQALWYNALKTMELLAKRFEEYEKAKMYGEMAEKARASFLEKFWNSKGNCLYDFIHDDGTPDSSLRPNQIIAVALDFSMLDREKNAQIVDVVWKKLATPYGLKSLSDDDPRYCGRYAGGWDERNLAYHNGTVWPWLLGPFITAFLKAKNYSEEWRTYAYENFLKELFTKHIFEAGLGTISEIFDGDPPHMPRGCISQAWSVAEPLRAYVEDVLYRRPPFEGQILSCNE